jgi:hypothetical protein
MGSFPRAARGLQYPAAIDKEVLLFFRSAKRPVVLEPSRSPREVSRPGTTLSLPVITLSRPPIPAARLKGLASKCDCIGLW